MRHASHIVYIRRKWVMFRVFAVVRHVAMVIMHRMEPVAPHVRVSFIFFVFLRRRAWRRTVNDIANMTKNIMGVISSGVVVILRSLMMRREDARIIHGRRDVVNSRLIFILYFLKKCSYSSQITITKITAHVSVFTGL